MNKTISVVLATHNEEKNIEHCLKSVQELADEIIIVDGQSTDKTGEIAKRYNAILKIVPNQENFHINKQIAINMAKKDWVLQLDADEVVSNELAHEISDQINGKSELNGFWIPRKNWFLGRFLLKGGQYPDYQLRLYKNGKGKLPQKDVHEQTEVEGDVGYLQSPLLHYPYKKFSNYLSKWTRYNEFIAGQIREDLKKKNIIYRIFFGIGYLTVKPIYWFLLTYFRHKGFYDGWQGFVFSLFSALRFPVSYIIMLNQEL